ncbi:MAG: hypothetical protein A3D28_04220 [Omnitrophica bacterium RIFCSPHIGHO2_02_FULL_63_14]|nr:MAG: hypothetical protein A3D28_04220 [Omnitrophica bacterium RIFCSPHIGHO2_02_FULL_63_14]
MSPRHRILITGGAGFLGSYLCEQLLALGHAVTAFDMTDGRKIEHLMGKPNFEFIQDSILNVEALTAAVQEADLLFHFAAIADPKRYVQEPLVTLDIDLQGSLNIFKVAARHKIKVIFASTSEVYGRNPNVPWREGDDRLLGATEVNRWCYASAKAACEHYVMAYHQQMGLPFVILRFFNVYGPRLDDLGSGRVIPVLLNQLLRGEPVTIHGDGQQTRSFAYVDDVVDGILRVALRREAENQIFNIGSAQDIAIVDLAKMLIAVGGFRSAITFVPYIEVFGTRYEDIPRRLPDVSKIKRVVGWEATTLLKEGLLRTINYYRNTTQPV